MPEVRKINLRLPNEVMAMAADQAHRMGVSTNTYILMAIRNFIPYQEKLLQRQYVPPAGMVLQGSSSVPEVAQAGRNEPCPCGSGKKYKFCHGNG